jgi:hypothetical protein
MTDTKPADVAQALLAAQKELPKITKDKQAHHSKYADLATITEHVFPVLTKHGLVWTCQPTMVSETQLVLRWALIHAPSGDRWTGDYPIPATSPQTIGGNMTYARRYALCAVVGVVADEDDDGQQAENEHAKQQQQRSRVRSRGQDPPPPFEGRDGADEPGSKTDLQRRKIMTAMGKMPHEVRAAALSDITGREIESTNDLSFNEAQKVLRRIDEERRRAAAEQEEVPHE